MKNDKGKQVFTGDTDDILTDKIIKHTKNNSSRNDFFNISENESDIYCYSTKKIIAVVLAILFSSILFFMLVRKFRKSFNK